MSVSMALLPQRSIDRGTNSAISALEELALPQLPSLYKLAFWLSRSAVDAEDLVQETLLKALREFATFNRPAAQLLYRIGNHRVSVYLEQRTGAQLSAKPSTDHSEFHVISFSIDEIDRFAVSDVDRARLFDLVSRIRQDQE